MLDILIKNGTVVDGSGAPRYPADIAIQGGCIVEIGRPSSGVDAPPNRNSRTLIDAGGCVVTPGFVDMHSHTGFTLPANPTADSLVHQGITTAVIGQCGMSLAPLLPETRAQVIAAAYLGDIPVPWDEWSTFDSYLQFLGKTGTSINVVSLLGHGTVRGGVMGFVADPPGDEQMRRMQLEVVRAMESGAIGVSTGLIYPPGCYARTEDLVAFCRPVGERGGFYFSHIRGEGVTLLQAVAEAIQIGRETGAAVQISHFKACGRENWPKAAQALALIDQARAEGLDVTADMYPYLAGSTTLVSVLPQWAQEGGKEATLGRLSDPETRFKMRADMLSTDIFRITEWDTVLISGSPRNRDYEGRDVADLSAEAGKTPHEWLFDALLETELHIEAVFFDISEENLQRALRHPAMMIGTDGFGRAAEGPLSRGTPHPRSYGTYPRVLGHYVREQKVISLEEAVWKTSGFPAQKLRWADRGLVKENYRADLVVLDPETVADLATYQEPHRYPAGISHVIVNGELVIQGGEHTGTCPGAVL